MIIYFNNIPGVDPTVPWEYNETANRAECQPPKEPIVKNNISSTKVKPLVEGLTLDNGKLVINDVEAFSKKYPYSDTIPKGITKKSTLLILSTFNPDKESLKDDGPKSARSTEKSHKRERSSTLTGGPSPSSSFSSSTDFDYPKSILLEILISENFNTGFRGETTSYGDLYPKQLKEYEDGKTQVIRTSKLLAHDILFPSFQLKAKLLDNIRKLLIFFNEEYQQFNPAIKLTHSIRKPFTDYFANAVLQAMVTRDNKLTAEKRLIKWAMLLEQETAVEDSDISAILQGFKEQLGQSTNFIEMHKIFNLMKVEVASLIEADLKLKSDLEAFNLAIETKMVPGYSSLQIVAKEFLQAKIPLLAFDAHIQLQNLIIQDIEAKVILRLSSNLPLQQQYPWIIGSITVFTVDLYLREALVTKIKASLLEDKKISSKISKLCDQSLNAIEVIGKLAQEIREMIASKAYVTMLDYIPTCSIPPKPAPLSNATPSSSSSPSPKASPSSMKFK